MTMVAAHSLPISDEAAKRAWIEQQLAELTAEERQVYESDAGFRSFVDLALADEAANPGKAARSIAECQAYGGDVERELEDLATGRHPLCR